MSDFEMPERQPTDGPVGVEVVDAEHVLLYAEGKNGREGITMSRYNAARALGILSVFLGIRLNRQDSKKIEL